MASLDRRIDGPQFSVARFEFARQSWATGAGDAAKTATLSNINGTIRRIDVLISSVSANPTVNVSITDHNGVSLVSFSSLADGTKHIKLAESHKSSQDADFNPLPVNGTLTVSIDPSADAGGTDQNLTVDVIIYVR